MHRYLQNAKPHKTNRTNKYATRGINIKVSETEDYEFKLSCDVDGYFTGKG
jgi:hypothetical protein